MSADIFTIGHSTQDIEQFVQQIKYHRITAIADVRSVPCSQRNPQFNGETLYHTLKKEGIRYVFLGKELGARSNDECCYINDKVQYALLARTKLFQTGINRVIEGAQNFRIALMCAEKDPLDCHRTILVARELVKKGQRITHILGDSQLETHAQAMSRLINQLGLSSDMLRSEEAALNEAYEEQAKRIAYDRKSHRIARHVIENTLQEEGQSS